MGTGLWSVLGALAATLGLIALAVHLLRRLQGGAAGNGRGVPIQVLQRVSLGPKQGVALLRVADRVLVVSTAESGTHLLTELTDAAREEALRPVAPPTGGSAPRGGFMLRLPRLGRLLLVAALALAPAAVRAQSLKVPAPARVAHAAPAIPGGAGLVVNPPMPPQVQIRLGDGSNSLQLSGAVGLVVFLGVLTLLPALFLLMTSFTRILIVLHFLRSALGTQTTPPSQLLVAVAVLLTGVVMNPVLQEANRTALQPYFNGQIAQAEAYQRGLLPFREFMLVNTREQDLALFTELSHATEARSAEELPTVTIVSAFVVSELRTAFQMGFVLYLPFVVVDVIVASVLMSLGMFMLPPAMVSLPFKLLLFVLADGWTLVVQNLVASFR
jgi:flagellar biosynthetic protein FliP